MSATVNEFVLNGLCLTCGLCCNGVIFADVELQPEDDSVRLKALGFRFLPEPAKKNRGHVAGPKTRTEGKKFAQPCSALDGCRCTVYDQRPTHCRNFECLLLKSVEAGSNTPEAARRIIRLARRRVDRVRLLLQELGDSAEHLALRSRYRKVTESVELSTLDPRKVDLHSQLGLAMHELNLLLQDAFYPGAGA